MFRGYGSPPAESIAYLDSPLGVQDYPLHPQAVYGPPPVAAPPPVRSRPRPRPAPAPSAYIQPGHNFLQATG